MNILLIEDDDLKADSIIQLLHSLGHQTNRAMSFSKGMQFLTSQRRYDLLVLDMTIPTFDPDGQSQGGSKRNFGGREILGNIKLLNIVLPTVVVSGLESFEDNGTVYSFDEVVNELLVTYSNVVVGGIHYHHSGSEWAKQLADILTRHNSTIHGDDNEDAN